MTANVGVVNPVLARVGCARGIGILGFLGATSSSGCADLRRGFGGVTIGAEAEGAMDFRRDLGGEAYTFLDLTEGGEKTTTGLGFICLA